jgi:hypothetical protein
MHNPNTKVRSLQCGGIIYAILLPCITCACIEAVDEYEVEFPAM